MPKAIVSVLTCIIPFVRIAYFPIHALPTLTQTKKKDEGKKDEVKKEDKVWGEKEEKEYREMVQKRRKAMETD